MATFYKVQVAGSTTSDVRPGSLVVVKVDKDTGKVHVGDYFWGTAHGSQVEFISRDAAKRYSASNGLMGGLLFGPAGLLAGAVFRAKESRDQLLVTLRNSSGKVVQLLLPNPSYRFMSALETARGGSYRPDIKGVTVRRIS